MLATSKCKARPIEVAPDGRPRPLGALALVLTLIWPLAFAAGCGEDYRDSAPSPAGKKKGEVASPFLKGCQELKITDPDNLLLHRLAKASQEQTVVCRKIAESLEKASSLDLSAGAAAEQLRSVTLVYELGKLTKLNLAGNAITDIRDMRKLSNLTWLDLSGNEELGVLDAAGKSANWQIVSRLPLRQLNIAGTQTDNLSNFGTLYFLTHLDISGNPAIDDLTPIGPLEFLDTLNTKGIALGGTTKATKKNCPVDARSKAVREFCRGLLIDQSEGSD